MRYIIILILIFLCINAECQLNHTYLTVKLDTIKKSTKSKITVKDTAIFEQYVRFLKPIKSDSIRTSTKWFSDYWWNMFNNKQSTLTDGILRNNGSTLAPWTAFNAASLYYGTINPSGSTRLNWDGNLFATTLYSGGYQTATYQDTLTRKLDTPFKRDSAILANVGTATRIIDHNAGADSSISIVTYNDYGTKNIETLYRTYDGEDYHPVFKLSHNDGDEIMNLRPTSLEVLGSSQSTGIYHQAFFDISGFYNRSTSLDRYGILLNSTKGLRINTDNTNDPTDSIISAKNNNVEVFNVLGNGDVDISGQYKINGIAINTNVSDTSKYLINENARVRSNGLFQGKKFTTDSTKRDSTLSTLKYVDDGLSLKQNTLTNPVTGTGGSNYITKFTGTSTVGNSGITDDGTTVNIGTSASGQNLIINATDSAELAPPLTGNSGTNWTLSNTTGYTQPFPGTIEKTGDGTGTITTTATTFIKIGKTYKVTIVVASISGSTATWTLGGANAIPIAAATTYTEYITATNTNKLIITPTATSLRIVISSISIKAQTNSTGDLIVGGRLLLNGGLKAANNVDVMNVTASGKIGIGTTIVSSTDLLNINGSMTVRGIICNNPFTTTHPLELNNSSSTFGYNITTNAVGLPLILQTRKTGGPYRTNHLVLEPNTGNIGINVLTPTNTLSFDGQSAQNIGIERNTTSNTIGSILTIKSGGATIGATDKDAGMLTLSTGLSTGTGKSSIRLQRLTRTASTSTSDNTYTDAFIVTSEFNLVDNTDNSLFEIALPTLAGCAGKIEYGIFVTDGVDIQTHAGFCHYAAVNKGGVYTTQIQDESSTDDANANSAGTLTESWDILTGTDKVTIRCNFNTSLTPTIMKIRYTITNNSGQTITQL